ncbi:hypothetical protein [Dyadobacter sandarakinus]|uniref:Uncharacterized protein n=1 Tax=Dyadobacter sandarakinus TaxID=2747268 RepID=A0ABX7I9P4_9BACT|nr:hypothetical protein [Dyadobacter sandarakinus]QRR02705.1 hypothetical protein HWI92_18185 [Dyadobacter sandarakinus]
MNNRSWENTYSNAYHTLKLFSSKNDACPSAVRYILDNVLYDERMVWQEQLMFTNIPPQPGRYALTSEILNECDTSNRIVCLLFSQMELDVGGDSFIILENEENYFDIQEFNTKTGEIKGQFKCTFVLKPPRLFKKVFPDTLRFTEGQYYAKLVPPRFPK